MPEGTYGGLRGADSAYRKVWQALTDAVYFYERHAHGGVLQASEALKALDYLCSLAKLAESAASGAGATPNMQPLPGAARRQRARAVSIQRYHVWPARRRAG